MMRFRMGVALVTVAMVSLLAGNLHGQVQGRRAAASDEMKLATSYMAIAGDTEKTHDQLAELAAAWNDSTKEHLSAAQVTQLGVENMVHSQWLIIAQNQKVIERLDRIAAK